MKREQIHINEILEKTDDESGIFSTNNEEELYRRFYYKHILTNLEQNKS